MTAGDRWDWIAQRMEEGQPIGIRFQTRLADERFIENSIARNLNSLHRTYGELSSDLYFTRSEHGYIFDVKIVNQDAPFIYKGRGDVSVDYVALRDEALLTRAIAAGIFSSTSHYFISCLLSASGQEFCRQHKKEFYKNLDPISKKIQKRG